MTPRTDSRTTRTALTLMLIGLLAAGVLSSCGSKDQPEPQPAALVLCQDPAYAQSDQRDTDLKQRYPGMDAPRKLALGAAAAHRCRFDWTETKVLDEGLQLTLRQPLTQFPEKSQLNVVKPDPKLTGHPDILPDFFETDLQGTGLYAAWSNLARAVDVANDSDFSAIDAKVLQELLGHALADITDPGRVRVVSPGFVSELHHLGAEKIQPKRLYPADGANGWVGPVEYGWTIFTPLLRFGDFHESFLVPLAVEILRFDQANGGNWAVPGQPSHLSYDLYAPDATTGMPALLEALSRNRTALEQVSAQVPDPRLDALLAGK